MATTTQLLAVYRELEKKIAEIDLRQGGPSGPRGSIGPKGRKGEKGSKGDTGTQGPTGPAGASGSNGKDGKQGLQGTTGPQGPQGLSGANGADGRNGRDGTDGVSVTDAQIDFDGHLTLQMSDGTVIDAGLIQMSAEGDITYVAGGGIPDQYKKGLEEVIEDLNDHLADFDNPHRVAHDQLIDSTTTGEAWEDKHHNRVHTLGASDHSDVVLTAPIEQESLIYEESSGNWVNGEARHQLSEANPTGLADGGELNISTAPAESISFSLDIDSPPEAVLLDSSTVQFNNAPSNAIVRDGTLLLADGTYDIEWELSDMTPGSLVSVRVGATQSPTQGANGVYNDTITVTGATTGFSLRVYSRAVGTTGTARINSLEKQASQALDHIEVLTGIGIIVDSYTDPDSRPVVQAIQWPQINEVITAAPAVAGSTVHFTIYDTGVAGTPINGRPVNLGALRQYPEPPTEPVRRDEIYLGVAVHNGDSWGEISSPIVINNAAHTLTEFLKRVAGPTFVIDGGTVTEAGGFTIDQEEGTVWEHNRNWHVNKKDPHREALPATTGLQWKYVNRDFTSVSGLTGIVDPTAYDDGGTITPVPGNNNRATIQILYQDPRDNYWVLWGQNVFDNAQEAAASVQALTEVPPLLQGSVLLCYIVVEKGLNDWDEDEAFIVYPQGGGGVGGGGVPITTYLGLADTPGSYLGDKRKVATVDELESNIEHTYRAHMLQYVPGTTYYPQETVWQDGWLSVANTVTTDYPAPTRAGIANYVYSGLSPVAPTTAKQVIFGNRYTFGADGYLDKYRIYIISGNFYSVRSVKDPLTDPIANEIVSFTASSTGWIELGLDTTLLLEGTVFDLVCIVQEPSPTPTVFTGNWNYVTPNNPGIPSSGQISHANNQLDQLRVHYFDNANVDRAPEIQALDNGDIVEDDQGTRWSIQNNADSGVYATLTVAPAIQSGPDGVRLFTFETTVATPISRLEDVNYWGVNPPAGGAVEGLYIEDGEYPDIVPNTSAYGVDIFVQEATLSPDWDIFGAPSGTGGGSSGGGGGAEFLDELGDVTLTSPAEGEVLVYNATSQQWENNSTLDGGTF